jgi:anthranilate synthase component 1
VSLSPAFAEFEAGLASGRTQLVSRRVVNDLDTPVSAYRKVADGRPFAFLLESVVGGEQRARYSIMGFAPDLIWRCRDGVAEIARGEAAIANGDYTRQAEKPLTALRTLQAESAFDLPDGMPPMAAGLFGYLGYDMIREVEALPAPNPDVIGTPDAILTRPQIIAIFDQIAQEVILATPVRPSEVSPKAAYESAIARLESVERDLRLPGGGHVRDVEPEAVTPTLGCDLPTFSRRVDKAREYVKAGDVFQVVIGQRLSAPFTHSALSLYRALRRLNPSPFLYLLNFDDHAVIGSSPEILVRLRENEVTVRPIAGTRPRGKTEAEDIALEADLLADPKERAEHLMLLDLGRNDVGRVAKPGTVKVTESYGVERYSHVMHIVSNVVGEIQDDLDVFDALFAGFPAGTVSGAPKVRAMEIIDELEDEKRGIYAGAVGYISAGGEMDTAIALRTAILKDQTLHVRAGAGIVLDSDPEAEWMETRHKARALFRAAEVASRFEGNG